jgi:hypothetical protein
VSIECAHQPRTGVVTSFDGGEATSNAQAPVCSDPACVADALAWVSGWSGKPARHVLYAGPVCSVG